jgi:hypothetical protein
MRSSALSGRALVAVLALAAVSLPTNAFAALPALTYAGATPSTTQLTPLRSITPAPAPGAGVLHYGAGVLHYGTPLPTSWHAPVPASRMPAVARAASGSSDMLVGMLIAFFASAAIAYLIVWRRVLGSLFA